MVIVFLWFLAMKNVANAGLGVTYIRSTGEHAPATIVGPSTRLERVSIPYPLMGSKDMRTMLNFAYTLCSSALFVSDVLGVGVRAGFLCAVSLCGARRVQARACLSTGTPCDRCFSDLGRACARGGGGCDIPGVGRWCVPDPEKQLNTPRNLGKCRVQGVGRPDSPNLSGCWAGADHCFVLLQTSGPATLPEAVPEYWRQPAAVLTPCPCTAERRRVPVHSGHLAQCSVCRVYRVCMCMCVGSQRSEQCIFFCTRCNSVQHARRPVRPLHWRLRMGRWAWRSQRGFIMPWQGPVT